MTHEEMAATMVLHGWHVRAASPEVDDPHPIWVNIDGRAVWLNGVTGELVVFESNTFDPTMMVGWYWSEYDHDDVRTDLWPVFTKMMELGFL